ncbi:MAG: ion transporter [Lachnospirales bacterium]
MEWSLYKFKEKIYKIIEKDDSGDILSRGIDILILTMIFVNVFIIVVESFYDGVNDPEMSQFLESLFSSLEILVVVTFTTEYILRLFVSDMRFRGISRTKAFLRTFFMPLALLELIALLPFYVDYFELGFSIAGAKSFRFLLMLKVGKYFSSFNLIGDVIKKKKNILLAVMAIMLIVILSASVFMYYIENPAQPENFPNILTTLWWGVVTLTTVGYGDVYPITIFGRILAGVVSIAGIGIVALPTGIISSGFLEELDLQSLDDDEVFEKGIKAVTHKRDTIRKQKFYCNNCGSEMHIVTTSGNKE